MDSLMFTFSGLVHFDLIDHEFYFLLFFYLILIITVWLPMNV